MFTSVSFPLFLAGTHGRSALGQQETFLHFASSTWILAREEDKSCNRHNVNTFTAEQNTLWVKKITRQREQSIEVDGARSLTNKAFLFIMQLLMIAISTSCPFGVHNIISLGISQDERVITLQGIM